MKASEILMAVSERPLLLAVDADDIRGEVAAFKREGHSWAPVPTTIAPDQIALVLFDAENQPRILTDAEAALERGKGFTLVRSVAPVPGSAQVRELPQVQTDAQKAEAIKEEARPILEALTGLMTRAERQGMRLDFAINRDGFGRQAVQNLTVLKVL